MRTASSAKAYIDLLADDVMLEVVEAKPNGIDLSECRSKIAELQAAIVRVRSLAAPADREILEAFVDEIRQSAEAEIAGMLRRWPHFASPEHLRMGNDRTALGALQTVMVPRDAMVDFLCAEIDAIADAAMPPSERPSRISELESELVALQAIEVMLVSKRIESGDVDVAHDPAVSPAVLLGINVGQADMRLRFQG